MSMRQALTQDRRLTLIQCSWQTDLLAQMNYHGRYFYNEYNTRSQQAVRPPVQLRATCLTAHTHICGIGWAPAPFLREPHARQRSNECNLQIAGYRGHVSTRTT